MKYRKKPVVIEAFRLGQDALPDWFLDARTKNEVVTFAEGTGNPFKDPLTHCEIQTLEGVMRADRGDYIIKGVQNEMYPYKPDIFAATYEVAE